MRVLEVGPGKFPAEHYLASTDVDYIAAEPGRRDYQDGESEVAFHNTLRLLGGDLNSATFFGHDIRDMSLDFGADLAYAANVLGDPAVIPRNRVGGIYDPDLAIGFINQLCMRADEVEIVEYYTPIDLAQILEIFGGLGWDLVESVDTEGMVDILRRLYPLSAEGRIPILTSEEHREDGAKYWGLPMVEPYFARFRKSE